MAWDATRPVPWKRLIKEWAIYAGIMAVMAASGLGAQLTTIVTTVGAELLLLHVADGWAARNFEQLKLAESDEMRADSEYLESTAERLRLGDLRVDTLLALGNPPTEIVKIASSTGCDIWMSRCELSVLVYSSSPSTKVSRTRISRRSKSTYFHFRPWASPVRMPVRKRTWK